MQHNFSWGGYTPFDTTSSAYQIQPPQPPPPLQQMSNVTSQQQNFPHHSWQAGWNYATTYSDPRWTPQPIPTQDSCAPYPALTDAIDTTYHACNNTHDHQSQFVPSYETQRRPLTDTTNTKHFQLEPPKKVYKSPKKHVCSICRHTFATQAVFEAHAQKCSAEARLFPCPYCDKVFRQKCTRTVHIRRHTGETPFKCSHCARTFADNSCRAKHERTHTQERKFRCDKCEYRSNQSCNLLRHKRAAHKH